MERKRIVARDKLVVYDGMHRRVKVGDRITASLEFQIRRANSFDTSSRKSIQVKGVYD